MPMLRLGIDKAYEDAGATLSFASTVVAVVVVTVGNESVVVEGSGIRERAEARRPEAI